MRKAIAQALLALTFLALIGAAFQVDAQTHDHTLYGGHPAAGAHDPYLTTKNVSGGDCCHGADCQRFYGDPVRATVNGKAGYKFGEWFVEDARMIPWDQLPVSERGYHHICIHDFSNIGGYEGGAAMTTNKQALCGYVAMGV